MINDLERKNRECVYDRGHWIWVLRRGFSYIIAKRTKLNSGSGLVIKLPVSFKNTYSILLRHLSVLISLLIPY
jgi:hypothetical protein